MVEVGTVELGTLVGFAETVGFALGSLEGVKLGVSVGNSEGDTVGVVGITVGIVVVGAHEGVEDSTELTKFPIVV